MDRLNRARTCTSLPHRSPVLPSGRQVVRTSSLGIGILYASQQEQEDFENTFFYFIDALKILSSGAQAQCEELDGYHVPWELRQDVYEGGKAIAHAPTSPLSIEQRARTLELVEALNRLPKEALSPPDTLTDNHAGSLLAMNHPSWDPIRRQAAELLELIEPIIQQNRNYFERTR